ncbi:MAG: hypothetical protein HQM03_09250 [Magnetococcales bacterium]|nr:hypothetical protein [Magnetococcales bacterium]MBF0296915.1 hypothetical protein [Magnetococcales bacterium]
MTYNEAIVAARENAAKTRKSWYIFSDGRENYKVRDHYAGPQGISGSESRDFQVTAVVHPVWQD